MNKLTQPINYPTIVKEIRTIIGRGTQNLQKALQRQVVATNWQVGRYLKTTLPLDDAPSAGNARIISRLARDFGRSDNYFYALIKFYRYYPELPRNASSLSWSHYAALLKIDDAKERKRYEQMAVRKKISSKILHGLIANNKANVGARRAVPLQRLQSTRGQLYHYKVTAPKDAASNTGTATLDVGFKIFRDIPLNKKSRLHVGHMVRTIRSDESKDIFFSRISNDNKDRLYTYVAAVERVVDGDTLIAMIDLGLKTKTRQRLRLRGIDCPELTTKRGKYVKDYVKKVLGAQKFIIIKTYKDDKYGRMLADVFYGEPGRGEPSRAPRGITKKDFADPAVVVEEGVFLNQELLDKGLAAVWQGPKQ